MRVELVIMLRRRHIYFAAACYCDDRELFDGDGRGNADDEICRHLCDMA